MKRLVIIVEGETEEAFVHQILAPYIWNSGYTNSIQCFKIKHSGGGVSKYSHIERDILATVREKDVIVTTMFDFYGLPSDTPGFKESLSRNSHVERVKLIEDAIKKEITQKVRENIHFIPYIQLHEIEALIFSSNKGFYELFDKNEADLKSLDDIIKEFPNPEDIDNGPDTAPSKRLKKAIPEYDKVLYGIGMLQTIGIETIMEKSPHFKEWVVKIINELSKEVINGNQ